MKKVIHIKGRVSFPCCRLLQSKYSPRVQRNYKDITKSVEFLRRSLKQDCCDMSKMMSVYKKGREKDLIHYCHARESLAIYVAIKIIVLIFSRA